MVCGKDFGKAGQTLGMMEGWKLGTRLWGLSGLSRRGSQTGIAPVTAFNEGGNEVSAKNNEIWGSPGANIMQRLEFLERYSVV